MRFLIKLFRTANKDIIDECRSFCNFPLPTEMLEIKSNKFCKKLKCNKISVLAKRFSFVVIVILLYTLVRSHDCLFVCCSYFFLLLFLLSFVLTLQVQLVGDDVYSATCAQLKATLMMNHWPTLCGALQLISADSCRNSPAW